MHNHHSFLYFGEICFSSVLTIIIEKRKTKKSSQISLVDSY